MYEVLKIIKNNKTPEAKVDEYGYIPGYTRTQPAGSLHEDAGFRTDYKLIAPNPLQG